MHRIHAGYHKCLTKLYIKIMHGLFNRSFIRKEQYRHFENIQGSFYNLHPKYNISSTNGFAIDLKKIEGEFRISRFIRDPRDLVISGYFYHKRGAEPWFRMKRVSPSYWADINGNVPKGMDFNLSYAEYLQQCDLEEGLIAEIEFRKHHFNSMLEWEEHPNILIFKYEDLIRDPEKHWLDLFNFYQFSKAKKRKALRILKQATSTKKMQNNKHVRNPKAGQWKEYFSPKVNTYFEKNHPNLIQHLGY